MQVTETNLKGVYLIEPKVFSDHRGWFTETYSLAKLSEKGIDTIFIQDNHSYSVQKGTLRGIHFQNSPKAQTKLVRCTRGAILDIAIDLRKGSPQFAMWVAINLTSDNHRQLHIPKGFGHGFITLTDDTEVQYKVDEYYSPDCDRCIRFDDPELAINWGWITPILSAKDRSAPLMADSDCNFTI